MLCLLNVSENGFGRFKVGIAGVRRLLASRGTDSIHQSDLAVWATQWFTWLDVIASVTLDDINSDSKDFFQALHISASLGSLEYVANCQGRLFKLVAQLADWSPSNSRLTPSKDFYRSRSVGVELDHSSSFWSPLRQVHARLNSFASHPNFHSQEADPIVVAHLADVFKHAAAIYAERQSTPSSEIASSGMIQRLVAGALCSIITIPANSSISQFLIWPLLIIASECVDPADRETVRWRVSASSSTLSLGTFTCADILLKVWSLQDGGIRDDVTNDDEDLWPGLKVMGARATIWGQAITSLNYEQAVG
jgi:hypothetical protein